MGKYLVKRLLHGAVSIIVVVIIVMVMVYSLLDRQQVFAGDSVYTRQMNNAKQSYMYSRWEEYGYLDYVTYAEWLQGLTDSGEIDEETRSQAVAFGRKPENDSELVQEYVTKFNEYYESRGYTIVRLNAKVSGRKLATGGQQVLFAYRDVPLLDRIWDYFSGLVTIDNIHKVQEDIGERGLTFTWFDPVYGGEKLSPAIIGNGTTHKYLLYVDDQFPYLHQNFATIQLGTSYTVNKGVDVFTTMTSSQGSYVLSTMTFPSGYVEESADDLHTAIYRPNSKDTDFYAVRYTDD